MSKGNAAPRILVVEDDEAIRALLLDLLGDAGYAVDEARNGRDGLERVRQHAPDLILLDKYMPDVDGTTFAHEYDAGAGRAPIVALCAERDATEWSAEIGAAAVVTKPFNIDDLLSAVRAALGKAGRA